MKDKRVLVTGASSGIGFQIAGDFLKRGAFVGAHYCHNQVGASKLLDNTGPTQCQIFQADFSRSNEVHRLWDEFMTWSGRIDVLVNNAGEASHPASIYELTEDAWDKTFLVNLKAPFLLSRAALSVMSQQHSGRIINISSIGVKFGGSTVTVHYSASKAALEAITKSFAKAGAPFNVLVNAVQVGITNTSLHQKVGRKNLSERISLIPLKRLAEPSEISNMVLFLASEESSFITGTVMSVSGGE